MPGGFRSSALPQAEVGDTNPTRVMGTFLRTGRAERAGLGQAYVAIAIASLQGGRPEVGEYRTREGEKGQPTRP